MIVYGFIINRMCCIIKGRNLGLMGFGKIAGLLENIKFGLKVMDM